MKYLTALLISLLCLTAQANEKDKEWGHIVTVEGGLKIYGRYGSFERYNSGGSIVVRFNKGADMYFYVVVMSDKDCDVGYGQLVVFDTGGKLLKKESWVAKGGNGVSAMGDLVCLLINKPTKSQDL